LEAAEDFVDEEFVDENGDRLISIS